jgi:hypothetical protein
MNHFHNYLDQSFLDHHIVTKLFEHHLKEPLELLMELQYSEQKKKLQLVVERPQPC